ncbi:histidine phosphatase family protein [Streptomyces sp. NPDC058202]|uniref:histidine phosphatase family protein n=1 Tax=Streptomyces sp. NPDC058202 TaxID=3346380 RepID=UPI0036E52D6E
MTTDLLTVIRHAPTSSNGASVFMGGMDVPATPEGLRAAEQTAPTFVANRFGPVFASPLKRALDTACALFPEADIWPDVRLAERRLGLWEGQPHAQVRAQYPEAFLPDGSMDPHFTPPQGEALDAFLDRIRSFLREAAAASQSHSPVAVSHNGWIRTAQYVTGHIHVDEIFVQGIPFLEPIELDLRLLLAGPVKLT